MALVNSKSRMAVMRWVSGSMSIFEGRMSSQKSMNGSLFSVG